MVGFEWMPVTTGYRCLLAAVSAPLDPSLVPINNNLLDFGALNGPDKAFTPLDNNLAQRNVKVIPDPEDPEDPGLLGNPFDEPIALGIGFDCNDFPINDTAPQADARLRSP